ncbi:MAG: hypothetical protein AB9835_11435 [Eubacteriales bacterium]
MNSIFEQILHRIEQKKANAFCFSLANVGSELQLEGGVYRVQHSFLHVRRGKDTMLKVGTGYFKPSSVGDEKPSVACVLASKSKNDIAANIIILDSNGQIALNSDQKPDEDISGFHYICFSTTKDTIHHLLLTIFIPKEKVNSSDIIIESDPDIGNALLHMAIHTQKGNENEGL